MGEISDALRRARQEGARTAEAVPELERPSRPRRKPLDVAAPVEAALEEAPADLGPASEAPILPVSRSTEGRWQAREVLVHEGSPAAESYRQLAVRVGRELEKRSARSLLVVGPLRQEGKTTTACNLALALASLGSGERVALVDLDLRRPSIAGALGLPVATGIEEVLAGEVPLGAARMRTDVSDLDVFAVRTPCRRPEKRVAGSAFPALLKSLESAYGVVVIDTPPVLLVPDTTLMAARAGACLLVARAGRTHTHSVRSLLDTLPAEKLIGCFLNEGKSFPFPNEYGYYLSDEPEGD